MSQVLNCLICKKEVYSEIGKGCKMCGMLLEDKNKDIGFCCKSCLKKYKTINKIKK